MPKVYYTKPLGPLSTINNQVWDKLDNGWYLSPELSLEEAKALIQLEGFREVVIPAEPAPQPAKKPAVKKTTAKPKGGE
ncbi:hypothetical protein ACFLMW_003828 [Salmonella enterica]